MKLLINMRPNAHEARNTMGWAARLGSIAIAIAAGLLAFFFLTFFFLVLACAALGVGIWWLVAGRKRFAQFKAKLQSAQAGGAPFNREAPQHPRGRTFEGEIVRKSD
jgi:hypothetical protein